MSIQKWLSASVTYTFFFFGRGALLSLIMPLKFYIEHKHHSVTGNVRGVGSQMLTPIHPPGKQIIHWYDYLLAVEEQIPGNNEIRSPLNQDSLLPCWHIMCLLGSQPV